MYCKNCGAEIVGTAKFCKGCGAPIQMAPAGAEPEKVQQKEETIVHQREAAPKRPVPKKKKSGKGKLLLIPAVLIIALVVFVMIQFGGIDAFVEDYLMALQDKGFSSVEPFYRWEYVEQQNAENASNKFTEMFQWDTLEDYVYSNDQYYRHVAGKQVKEWKITRVEKNYLTVFDPSAKVEARVACTGSSREYIVQMYLHKDGSGWYLSSTNAYYAD